MSPYPTHITLNQSQRTLEIEFDHQQTFTLSWEYLRIYSPSAEVRGHGNRVIVRNKANVAIVGVEPVGHYAIRLIFSDGHKTGLYSWEWLYDLGVHQAEYWLRYQQELLSQNDGSN